MPSTKEIRRRIKSVKNTSQITKAMQMVSATKMRKAQNQALDARPYTLTLNGVLATLSGKVSQEAHPLLSSNTSSKVGVLLFTTDKGLCGALNSNLIRTIQGSSELEGKEITYYTVGKKGRDFIVRSGKNLEADFESQEKVSMSDAVAIRKLILPLFLNSDLGMVYLLYSDFISTLRQEPKLAMILPIDPSVMKSGSEVTPPGGMSSEFVFEPNPDSVLDYALTHMIDIQIYQALLETKASEHSARMVAMKNATDNAKDLVSDLSLTYNQMRQNAVTSELLEITSAQSALEG